MVCLGKAEEMLYFFKISLKFQASAGVIKMHWLSISVQKPECAEVRDTSYWGCHLGSSLSSSDAVESPTTLTGLKYTIQPGFQTPAA